LDLTKFVVLGIYVAILFLIGIFASRRVSSLSDFYLGGKRLGYWAVAFSARATGESGWLLIGLTGMGALSGLSAYWVVVGEVLGVAVSWWFMAKKFKRKSDAYGSITIPDYLESHFKSTKKTIRILSATILSVFVIIYVSSQIDVTGKAFESMMGLDYFTGAIIGFLIVLSYIFIGGFVAAVWSDMFQGILMFLGFMSIRDESEIDKGKWVAIIFTLFTDAAAVTIGILGRIFFTQPGQDPQAVLGVGAENVLSMLTEQFLPYVLVAIYVAIVLSAIMSTIDSLLVIASSAITRDFYQKIFKPNLGEKEMVKISRWVTLIMSVVALIIAMVIAKISPDRTVFWMVIFGWSGIAATFCPVIILSLFWNGLTEKGAIASMITGFLCVPFFKFVVIPLEGVGPYFEKLDVLGPSFLISMFMAWLFSKLYKKSSVSNSIDTASNED